MPTPNESYSRWLNEQTPEAMAEVLQTLDPVLTSEVSRYQGPKQLLKSKAKALTISAVRAYNPTDSSGAQLASWVTTQLQPLSRYGREMSEPVRVGETSYRQNAAILKATAELTDDLGAAPTDDQLADHLGVSARRISKIRELNRPVQYEGAATDQAAALDSGSDDPVLQVGTDPLLEEAKSMTYASLAPRDQVIYDLRTGSHGKQRLDNVTIAKRLGVSPAYVSQRASYIGQLLAQQAQ